MAGDLNNGDFTGTETVEGLISGSQR
jgi:hypothetical protein